MILGYESKTKKQEVMLMEKTLKERIRRITARIIVGIDTGKDSHWARITDYRGIDLAKPAKVNNNEDGFESLMEKIKKASTAQNCGQVVIGMEPSGHYWRALGWYLKLHPICPVLVGVNPYHTKQAKELDDNSPTKSDKKDAQVIAHLIRDGRYFDTYLPEGHYAELRILNTERQRVMKQINRSTNTIIAIMDEYFPEYSKLFDNLVCPTSCAIIRAVPFPGDVLAAGFNTLLKLAREASNGKEGQKLAGELTNAAIGSVGVQEGKTSARFRLMQLLDELAFHQKQCDAVEEQLSGVMENLELGEILRSMKGIGLIISASFLGEIGDITRFSNWKQVRKLAGLNLVENSSGKRKSGTAISKRGRPHLRYILYMAGETCILHNPEMKSLYYHFRRRSKNPLHYYQAVVAVGLKVMRIMFHMLKNNEKYDPAKALGKVRTEQIAKTAGL